MRDPQPIYDPCALHLIGYADGFSVWSYRTRDPLPVIREPGYLDPAFTMFRDGDRLHVNVRDAAGETLIAQDFVVARRRGRVGLTPLTPAVEPGAVLRERFEAEAQAA